TRLALPERSLLDSVTGILYRFTAFSNTNWSRASFPRAASVEHVPSLSNPATRCRDLGSRWPRGNCVSRSQAHAENPPLPRLIGVRNNRGGMAKQRRCTIAGHGLLMRLVRTASRA